MAKPKPKNPHAAARRAIEKARTELQEQYKTTANGIIRDPGPFEGQPLFVAYYYETEAADEEFVDDYERDVVIIFPDDDDRAVFLEIAAAGATALWIWEDESGRILSRPFAVLVEERSARDEIAQNIDDETADGDAEEEPEEDEEEEDEAPDEPPDDPGSGSAS